MDAVTFWSVLGIAATIIFGVWTLYYSVVSRRYPGRITFVREACIGLFDAIVRNFPEITILYENNPVGKNLVLLKGAFVNSGTKDIAAEMVARQLTIVLPPDYSWLTARVVAASQDATPSISPSADRSKLNFDLGLFRCGEYLRFEALAEVPNTGTNGRAEPENSLKSAISFSHRIADTRKVESTELSSIDPLRSRLRVLTVAMMAFQAVAGAALVGYSIWHEQPMLEGKLEFAYSASPQRTELVNLTPQNNGMLRLEGVNDKFEAILPVERFFYASQWKPVIVKSREKVSNNVIIAGLSLISFGFVCYVAFSVRKEARLRGILSLNSKKSG